METIKNGGLKTAIIIGGFLIAMSSLIIGLNANSYGKLNAKFETNRVVDEHRLTEIETLLQVQNIYLAKIELQLEKIEIDLKGCSGEE